MTPFSVTVQHVPDRELGPLLTRLAEAGFDNPIIKHVDAERASDAATTRTRGGPLDLPEDWRLVREREGESYRWPKRARSIRALPCVHGHDARRRRSPDRAWRDVRENKWGRDRKYVVAFLSGGSPQQPLVEFVAADDYEQTRELVAVIRGSDGGRRMYGVGDALPAVYTERFRTQIYNERVVHPGAWNKLVVVAREDDDEAILNHALIQSRRRYRT